MQRFPKKMMVTLWIFVVFALARIDASMDEPMFQAVPDACPAPDITFCDFVQCENGRCVDDKTSSQCFQCQCDVGFTGMLCETALVTPSGCNPVCLNGGQCEQTAGNTVACVCPPEFTGSQCQTSLLATHPCLTNPGAVCQNGGTCTVDGAGFLCNCPPGWNGTNCQIPESVTQCDPNPCGLHGTCIQATAPTGPLAFCICEARWTGRFCDINLDNICSAGYCQSGGTCRPVGTIPTCQCPPTHTGERCETSLATLTSMTTTLMTTTTPFFTTTTTTGRTTLVPVLGNCSSGPCLNGGSCFNTGNQFVCLCTPQWSGPTCAVGSQTTTTTLAPGIDACSSNPCSNGGSCYKFGTSFVCTCTSAFTGPTCALPKTTTTPSLTTSSPTITCANRPCRNSGTCYNSGNSYFCYCGPNNTYTGKNCETSTSMLSSNCPLNCSPGYCVATGSAAPNNAYACMCNGILTPTSCS